MEKVMRISGTGSKKRSEINITYKEDRDFYVVGFAHDKQAGAPHVKFRDK